MNLQFIQNPPIINIIYFFLPKLLLSFNKSFYTINIEKNVGRGVRTHQVKEIETGRKVTAVCGHTFRIIGELPQGAHNRTPAFRGAIR